MRSNLATTFRRRYLRTRDARELEAAIAIGSQALTDPDLRSADRGAVLSTLADSYRIRAERTTSEDDLAKAISLARDAVGATKPRHMQRALRLNTLTVALRLQAAWTGTRMISIWRWPPRVTPWTPADQTTGLCAVPVQPRHRVADAVRGVRTPS